jgi:hypothetical protein
MVSKAIRCCSAMDWWGDGDFGSGHEESVIRDTLPITALRVSIRFLNLRSGMKKCI